MTYQLSVDPGLNTGIALGFYDAITPYQLIQRWQVHGGTEGFIDWIYTVDPGVVVDEIVYEKFVLDSSNSFVADIVGVPIEGALALHARSLGASLLVQTRSDKSSLVGYPKEAVTKAQRQRIRFDFLKRAGLFKPGTENDDTNDAITHALVSLKRRKHIPTIKAYWPRRDVA